MRIITSVVALASFQVVESHDADGVLRMALIGELDLAVADSLSVHLEQLRHNMVPVRLDLSGLEFIDSSGISLLLKAVQDGCDERERLVEVDRVISDQILAVIDLTGVAPVLWAAG